MFGELTFYLLIRNVSRVELLCNLASHGQIQLPADLDRDLGRIAERIQNRRRLAVPRHEHRLVPRDQFGDVASEFTNRRSLHERILPLMWNNCVHTSPSSPDVRLNRTDDQRCRAIDCIDRIGLVDIV